MLYYKQMEIEFNPLYGFMLGVNYAYYPEENGEPPLHYLQIAVGIGIIGITWIA